MLPSASHSSITHCQQNRHSETEVFFFRQNKCALQYMKKVTLYCTDGQFFKRMVTEENAIDWSTYFLIGGNRLLQII